MTFDEAMRFVEHERAFPADPGRVHGERFAALLDAAGLSVRLATIPSIVIAGSAGKGSTTRMIAALARGLFDLAGDGRPVVFGTKPPLRETNDGHRERYQSLDHDARTPSWISREAFTAHVEALAPHVVALERSHGPFAPFDLRYAILAREAVERGAAFVVVEANIGLRRDVSRAWPGVRAAALTRIGVEHGALLVPPAPLPPALEGTGASAGPLWHKAGGVWPGVPVISGPQTEPNARALDALVRAAGASEHFAVGRDAQLDAREASIAGVRGSITLDARALGVQLGLLGGFQLDNAATAALAARVLQREDVLPGDLEALAAATERLADVRVPGRMELVARAPITIRNVTEAPTKARSTLDELRALGGTRLVVVLTTIARVEGAEEVVRTFAAAPEIVRLVATAWHESDAQRDMAPARIAELARAARPDLDVVIEPNATHAIERARHEAGEGEVVVLIGDGLANAWEELGVGRSISAASSG